MYFIGYGVSRGAFSICTVYQVGVAFLKDGFSRYIFLFQLFSMLMVDIMSRTLYFRLDAAISKIFRQEIPLSLTPKLLEDIKTFSIQIGRAHV